MSGLRVYLLDSYNWIDFIVLSLYLASYVLRFLVEHRVAQAELYYNGTTARSRDALLRKDYQLFEMIRNETFANRSMPVHRYFMVACTCKRNVYTDLQERVIFESIRDDVRF
jgi:hypothetical protein